MDEILQYEIELFKREILEEDAQLFLREKLTQLEEKCQAKCKGEDAKVVSNNLWIRLIQVAIEYKKVDLMLLIIAKLNIVQLALLVRSFVQSEPDELSKYMALSYGSDYFCIPQNDLKPPSYNTTNGATLLSSTELINFYINKGDWSRALSCIDEQFSDARHRELNKQLVYSKYAEFSETDENFSEALEFYEKALNHKDQSIRLLIKMYLDSSYAEVRKYCSGKVVLQADWRDYSLACGFDEVELYEKDLVMTIRYNFLTSADQVEKKVFDLLPERLVSFIGSFDGDVWSSKKNLNYLISLTSSLDSNTRMALAELAAQYRQANFIAKACSLYLCLNQFEVFAALSSKGMHQDAYIDLLSTNGNSNLLIPILLDSFNKKESKHSKSKPTNGSYEQQFKICSELGLLNEAMLLFTIEINKGRENEGNLNQVIDYLNIIIADKNQRSLDSIDPIIENSTLENLHKSLHDSDQILSTYVITIVILSITIFLLKLEIDTTEKLIFKLETLFTKLIEYLNDLNFNASDNLIRATGTLIVTVKDKLEILIDNDVIRESFSEMVKIIAARCMIDSQYKSAAMLYSHIEDNVSAIKSLMRLGDVNIVMNYSLLVKDITVNRITINYLKHLDVDATVIEDFIAKSKL